MVVIPFKLTSLFCLSVIYVVLAYGISLQFRFIPLTNTVYREVPDPYYEGPDGFELVLDLLEDAIEGLIEKL